MDRRYLSIFFVAYVLLLSQAGWAQEPVKNWQFSASARYRFEDSSYANLKDRRQFSHLRVNPLVTFDESQGVKLVLEGQYVKIMGQSYLELTDSGAQLVETSSNSSYRGDLDSFWMRQAYLDLELRDDLNLLLGRQSLLYGDQLIIGPSTWGTYGRSFDAARLRWSQGKSWADALYSVLRENTINNSQDQGDKTLSALYVSYEVSNFIPTLDLYYFYLSEQSRSATGPNNQHFGDYGTRILTQMGDWGWKIEYAQNFGTEGTNFIGAGEDSQNNMLDTTVTWKQEQQQWALQAFFAGKNWREMFPTTHAVLGKTDVLGRRNLAGAALRHKGQWSDLWSTELSFYYFTRNDNDTAAFAPNSVSPLGDPTEKSRDLGTEVDLIVKYKLNPKTAVSASVSAFQYGEYFSNSASVDDDKTPLYSYIMVETQF